MLFSRPVKKTKSSNNDTNCFKKHWVTHELQGTEQRSWYLQLKKRGVVWMEKEIWKSLLGKKYLSRKPVHSSIKNTANNADTWRFIQQFFQHLYRTANSIVHLMIWVETAQILRHRQQHISPRRIQHSRVVLWLKSRQRKFTDIGNSIFLRARSSRAAKFSEGFTPCSLFCLYCREQQGLKTSASYENSQDYKNDVFAALWLEPKRVISSAGDVSSTKSRHFLPPVTTIKVPSKKMYPLQ